MNAEVIIPTLIRKLVYLNKWGNNHTNFDNLPKGFPKEIRKEVKKASKQLIRQGILLTKQTSYGLEVSLNPKKKKDIENIFLRKV